MKTEILLEWLTIYLLFKQRADAVLLNINDGSILGGTGSTVENNEMYYYFRGIPYGEPPLGDLRFEPPVAKTPWEGTIDCTTDGSRCIQESNPVIGSEDCLFINVYTPSLTGSLAVLVYIHGGAFVSGDTTYAQLGPDYFLEEGLVFVSFNYRLGIFGFIGTEDLTCPGNVGLKDQVLALTWVQRNIAFFGGNPQNVTIFGESAGAASVAYHVQSDSSRGLFSAAILDSGTSLSPWALNRRARETAFAVGAALSIVALDSENLINGLRKINATILQSKASEVSTLIMLQNALAGLQFGPVREPVHDGAFFTGESEDLLSRGQFNQVPCLMGVNSNEAAIVHEVTAFLRLYADFYEVKTNDLAPVDLTDDPTKRFLAANVIKCRYFNCTISLSASGNIIQFVSDDQFNRPTRKAVLDLSRFVPVYFYVFSYEGMLGGVADRSLPGVGHTEELGYLFRQYYTDVPNTDNLMRKRMVKMWSNFAKVGNPTPTIDELLLDEIWLPVELDHLYYMNIDANMELLENPFRNQMEFYDRIYKTFGTPPYDTF
ncbi:unnamed protein product [Phaedon cochleariae]|uniref:Carboxylic ester hydrolase n=1 Tax=Phaedon cochleariae TaxID=80249 RepID=A0A9P0DYE7_PHACE|nr:unnamed protein product [Phaedon cochleariae]